LALFFKPGRKFTSLAATLNFGIGFGTNLAVTNYSILDGIIIFFCIFAIILLAVNYIMLGIFSQKAA